MRRLTSCALTVSSLLALTALGAPSASAGDVSAAAWQCGVQPDADVVTIESVRNGRFVSAELNYEGGSYGMLRAARAEVGGSWEEFAVGFSAATRHIALRNLGNRRIVSTELNATGENEAVLRARATSSGGSWEQFVACYDSATGYWAFRSAVNGRYVSTRVDYTGYNANALQASATRINGSWEEFKLYRVTASSSTATLGSVDTDSAEVVPAA